jgi:hypothetical protein
MSDEEKMKKCKYGHFHKDHYVCEGKEGWIQTCVYDKLVSRHHMTCPREEKGGAE